MNYVIDGLFLTQNITGIQRYAYEICKELDKFIRKDEIEILVPADTECIPEYENLKIIKYGNHHGRAWEQFDLCRYLMKNKKQGIFLMNEISLMYPRGIACIHDISYKVNPGFFNIGEKRVSALWHRLNYSSIIRNCQKIVTVSEFSKEEIIREYHIDGNRLTVAYNSWQHISDIRETENIFEKYSFLKENEYYFSMATLAPNKNFRWILSAAKENPQSEFAIAGGGKLKDIANNLGYADLSNVHFLGYVSDEDAKALMRYCRAFLFPTLYEGFGIPPLEAVASGCRELIVSDIRCMHEIYGDYAYYIDPEDYSDIYLDDFTSKEDITGLLGRYSWKRSAQKIYNLL